MTRKKAIKVLKKKKKTVNVQRFTQVQNVGRGSLSAHAFRTLTRMTHSSKALRNVALYTWKKIHRETGKGASTNQIDNAIKGDVNYWGVQSNSAQAIRKTLLSDINGFFSAFADWKQHPEKYLGKPKFPKYLGSQEKRVIEIYQVPKVDKDGYWPVPMNLAFKKKFGTIKIRLPKNLRHQKITYIEIVPKHKGRFFAVHYVYEVQKPQMKQLSTSIKHVAAIDLGVDNLMSIGTNTGKTLLVNGKPLKSLNNYFNKVISRQQQVNIENGLSKRVSTKKQARLWTKRDRQINGYFSQAVGLLFKWLRENRIDTVVIGYNAGWKQKSDMGKRANQQFVQIPFLKLIQAIENKGLKSGIRIIRQEESYTSKASFLDRDTIPTFGEAKKKHPTFKGSRVTRGQYISQNGPGIHADINGAMNIMRKANIVDIQTELRVKTPVKVQVQTRKTVA
ncbi:RNA-guided endonuclease TnpB family protein [Bacillus cereus]|nr:transposase [Bacillus cereus]HDR8330194.1 transposase [Bacillus cereus]HDR8335846.1 transposase [Bacillus cereus]